MSNQGTTVVLFLQLVDRDTLLPSSLAGLELTGTLIAPALSVGLVPESGLHPSPGYGLDLVSPKAQPLKAWCPGTRWNL